MQDMAARSDASPAADPGAADPRPAGPSHRFAHKRARIVDAATLLINRVGVKGMTFSEVAQKVELNTTSVTYYFRLKEQLAAAVFESTLSRLEALAQEAAREWNPRARLARFVELHFSLYSRVNRGEERAIAILSDMRTLDESVRAPLAAHWAAIFRCIRGFFGPWVDEAGKARATARAHMLTETIFWLPVWLARYSERDFDRARLRLTDLLENGLAPSGRDWTAAPLPAGWSDGGTPDAGRGNFLRAATRLISERGYRGASVERIASELKVTKGSFYHHLETKDDLVLECFRRSYQRVSEAQAAADAGSGSRLRRLSSAVSALIDVQLGGDWPLLRTTALHALPAELRQEAIERSDRMALRFAGTLADGIAEGSIRAIDPMIASQVIMSTINAAYELQRWGRQFPRAEAAAIYASTIMQGLVD